MKRCKRCYSIIEKKVSHCPSCGLEINFKNTYTTNENKKNLYNGGPKNNKKKGAAIVIAFIIFYVVMFIIGIVVSVEEEEYNENYEYEFDINAINDYLYSTKLMTEDYYVIWTYSLTNNVTKDIIVEKTSLSLDSLTNNYCKFLDINPTIDNARNCVKNAYIQNGTHEIAYNELNDFYTILENNYIDIEKLDILYDIYYYGVDLYLSISNEYSYDEFENKYNNAINNIEYLTNEYNNESI